MQDTTTGPSATTRYTIGLLMGLLLGIFLTARRSDIMTMSSPCAVPPLLPLPFGAQGSAELGCPDYSSYSTQRHPPFSAGLRALPMMRPTKNCRTFISEAVERIVDDLAPRFKDPDLAMLFSNAFTQTLDTTIRWTNDDLAFVVTGDITAEWLRDTFNQMNVYADLIPEDPNLGLLFKKIIALQARYISKHPFCNSFQAPTESGLPPEINHAAEGAIVDPPYDSQLVFECKFEIDSLGGFIALSNRYHEHARDSGFIDQQWLEALKAILDVLEAESRSTWDAQGFVQSAYNFSSKLDRVDNYGIGPPQKYTGMVGTSFRPADDKVVFRFNVADNAMLAVELNKVAALLHSNHPGLASRAKKLSFAIRQGIDKGGIINHPAWGEIFAFEVDGFGSYLVMDDANVPSLLSLPVLGYLKASSQVYQNTRNMVLSIDGNPYYNKGKQGKAVGSPHTGIANVWPMSLISQILTSESDDEITEALETILRNTAGLGLIHESFNVHNEGQYTRPWFAWANSYFAQMILDLARRKPELILKDGQSYMTRYHGSIIA